MNQSPRCWSARLQEEPARFLFFTGNGGVGETSLAKGVSCRDYRSCCDLGLAQVAMQRVLATF